VNGSSIPFNFNAASHVVTFNASLINGANVIAVSASNSGGADSKNTTVNYTQPVSLPLPVVTITDPASSPFPTSASSHLIKASVLNVTAASQIVAQLNGVNKPFSFNVATHLLSMHAPLINGANIITITATNPAGADSKSTTIVYNAPVTTPAPVVTITSPTSNPFNTNVNSAAITATVLNVASASEITVSVNGTNAAFNYNAATHAVTLNPALVAGANSIAVLAANAGGSDSKAITVIYTAPATVLPPVVTITSPTANPHNISANTFTVKATVLNVTSAAQIKVFQNNNPMTGFTYVAATKVLTFPANLNTGANWFKIKATNSAGSDSATVTIKVNAQNPTGTTDSVGTGAPGKPGKGIIGGTLGGGGFGGGITSGGATTSGGGPDILLVTPSSNAALTTDAVYELLAKTEVEGPANVKVKLNGAEFAGYSYNKVTKNISASLPLNPGANTVVIEATNSTGTKIQTIVITRQ
jgi:hypothetical protein